MSFTNAVFLVNSIQEGVSVTQQLQFCGKEEVCLGIWLHVVNSYKLTIVSCLQTLLRFLLFTVTVYHLIFSVILVDCKPQGYISVFLR